MPRRLRLFALFIKQLCIELIHTIFHSDPSIPHTIALHIPRVIAHPHISPRYLSSAYTVESYLGHTHVHTGQCLHGRHTRYGSIFSASGISTTAFYKHKVLTEELFGYVYPGKNATDVLDQIGNPNKSPEYEACI